MKKLIKFLIISLGLLLITILIIGGGFGSEDKPTAHENIPLIFAHRGVTLFHVENSSNGFEKAKILGFNAIETDVNCTKDGKLIIFHDASGERLLNKEEQIIEMDWDELDSLRLYYNGKETNSSILSLEDFLEEQNDSIFIYLDMKVLNKQIADSLLSILDKFGSTRKIIIADGNLFYLSYLKIRKPEITVALEGFDKHKDWLYYILPKKFKPDYYASFIHNIDEKHVSFLVKNHLLTRKIVYGVNSENISEVTKLGLKNIIYDYDSSGLEIEKIKALLSKDRKE